MALRPGLAAGQRYRPELDGLRAIAVLAVIATHLCLPGFSGGFLGVDVFFVLSGYLMTRDFQGRGGSAPLAFYGRRLRRILPAYYAVLAACVAAACFLLMPGELAQMGQGLVAAVLLVPNILFLTQTGYFEHPASLNPLLHSWSLGVEAQFYLLCPLLPWFWRPYGAHRGSRRWRHAGLFGAAVAAFFLSIVIRDLGHSAAFYLMPARLWEFLVGGLVAAGAVPRLSRQSAREGIAAAGLAALVASMVSFSSASVHPGVPTLVPCLGTAAIIHATDGRDTWVGRLLQHKALVLTGAISYSLYLWHWPLIVFARYAQMPFTPVTVALGLGGLFTLSALTWAFIEVPFRKAPHGRFPIGRNRPIDEEPAFFQIFKVRFRRKTPSTLAERARARRRAATASLGTAGLALFATGLILWTARGLPQRFAPEVSSVADFYDFGDRMPYREGSCFLTSRQSMADFKPDLCLHLDPQAKNVLVLGDSHAAHLWRGLAAAWPGVNFLQATASGCKPSLQPEGASRCTALMRAIIEDFLPSHHVDAIVVAALWDEADIPGLHALIGQLAHDATVVDLIGPVPRFDEPAATLLAQSLWRGDLQAIAAHRLASVPALDREMAAAFAGTSGLHYISAYQAMCPGQDQCLMFAAPGVPMQFDYHHLTEQGGAKLTQIFRDTKALNF